MRRGRRSPGADVCKRAQPLLASHCQAMAAPGAPDSPQVYHLTESKRFGAPLAAELVHIPTFARHPHRLEGRPPLSMSAPRGAWYNLGYFLDSACKSHLPGTMVSS